MREFENSPEALVIKGSLRNFFEGLLENIKGAFRGFYEWIADVNIKLPPLLKIFENAKANLVFFLCVFLYIVVMNIKTYKMFKRDKRYAEEEEERIPEFRLLLNMWVGGGIGGAIAMYKLRHKTRHGLFKVTAVITVLLQSLVSSLVFGFLGYWAFL